MQFKGYMRRITDAGVRNGGAVEFLPFLPEHFQQVGVGYGSAAGLPVLEAHQLVNYWNSVAAGRCFVYWLE